MGVGLNPHNALCDGLVSGSLHQPTLSGFAQDPGVDVVLEGDGRRVPPTTS